MLGDWARAAADPDALGLRRRCRRYRSLPLLLVVALPVVVVGLPVVVAGCLAGCLPSSARHEARHEVRPEGTLSWSRRVMH